MPDWAFLTNHGLVFSFLARHPRITARELSVEIGITERSVRKIIADLHNNGYITKKREGRRTRYGINPDQKLRHETHQEVEVDDFLEAMCRRQCATPLLGRVVPP